MKRIRTHVITDPGLQVTQLEDGHLEVREVFQDEDGDNYYQRYVVAPGEYTGDRDSRVHILAQRVHTSEVVATYREAEAARERKSG